MLIAIDLQNDIFDPEGNSHVEWTEKVRDGIENRIRKAVRDDEPIIYTRNLYPEFEHGNRSTESIRFDEELSPRYKNLLESHGDEYVKTFYGIPPRESIKLEEKYKEEVASGRHIEFIGAETNICVLANIMVVQNIFPHGAIKVNKNLVASNNDDLHDKTLEILSNMDVIVIEEAD